jgi:hypothetical protein
MNFSGPHRSTPDVPSRRPCDRVTPVSKLVAPPRRNAAMHKWGKCRGMLRTRPACWSDVNDPKLALSEPLLDHLIGH